MTRILSSLRMDRRGASVIEFALLAPIFIMMLIGAIEGGRMMWTRQTLEEVAQSTARCMGVYQGCGTDSAARTYAANRATDYGITTTTSNVTVNQAATCKGQADSKLVTITNQFDSALIGFLPASSARISVSACFPTLAPA